MGMLGKELDFRFPNSRQYGAGFALRILTAINLLNFADRIILSAIKDIIKDDLNITDFETSLPATGMLTAYMISAAIFGHLIDQDVVDRRYILAGGIAFWSFATAIAGVSRNLVQLILLRSLVGVGEAAFVTVAIPVISDFFPIYERNIAFGIFYLSIPVGGALGFAVGAVIGQSLGWRSAFFIFGFPGIVVAFFVLKITKPLPGINDNDISLKCKRGAVADEQRSQGPIFNVLHDLDKSEQKYSPKLSDVVDIQVEGDIVSAAADESPLAHSSPPPIRAGDEDEDTSTIRGSSIGATKKSSHSLYMGDFKNAISYIASDACEILSNRYFFFATAGYVANNFCVGGLVDWYATYLHRYFDLSVATAGLLVGAVTVTAGVGGAVLGTKVSEFFQGRIKSANFLIPAAFTAPATALLILSLNVQGSPVWLAVFFLFGAELFSWTSLAPISALSATVIPPRLRARSAGIQILIQKVLGDVISPPIIGALSDSSGSLQAAIQITWMALALCGVFWWAGYYFLPPLPISSSTESQGGDTEEHVPATFASLLGCGGCGDPLVLDVDGSIVRRNNR